MDITLVEELHDPHRVRVTITLGTVTLGTSASVTLEYPPEEADDLGHRLIAAARVRERPMSESA